MIVKKLAKIQSASLNVTDRDILVLNITVQYEEGCCQNICDIVLDTWDKDKKTRVGTALGCEIILQTLKMFKVDSFEKMAGKIVYVLGEGEGLRFKPKGMQNLHVIDSKNTKVVFEDIISEMVD